MLHVDGPSQGIAGDGPGQKRHGDSADVDNAVAEKDKDKGHEQREGGCQVAVSGPLRFTKLPDAENENGDDGKVDKQCQHAGVVLCRRSVLLLL